MVRFAFSLSRPPFSAARPTRAWRIGLLAVSLGGLLSCTAVPRAPAPAPAVVRAAPPVAAAPVSAASAASAASAPANGRAVVRAPAPAQPASAASAAATAIDGAAARTPPYGPAVAARFPDPAVNYATPAFQPGHPGFTSNAELLALMRGLVRDGGATGTTVRLLSLGSSQAGQPLEALLFMRGADTDPAALLRAGRPTVLLAAQQHGDEPAGSEAMIVIAQELAQGRLQNLLERINVVMLPRANPDGARDGRRLTASGTDLNRDHLLLKTPEAQAQAQLVRDYRPMVVVDAHEYSVAGRYLDKFGAVQRSDALVQYATTANLPAFVLKAAEEWFRQPLLTGFKTEGLSSEWYHTTSADVADKTVSMGGVQPDIGRNVQGLTNAVSFLIETRGANLGKLHLKRRVHTQVVAVTSLLQSAALRSSELARLRAYVDNEVGAQACQGEAVIEAAATPSEYVLTMLDPQTGEDKPVTVAWDSALELRQLRQRPRPCGYWLSADQSDAVMRLRGLGVRVQQLDEAGELRGEIYRETARESAARPDAAASISDSGSPLRVRVQTLPALLDVKAGGYYIGLDQPLANLVIAALEPDTGHSYLGHGIITAVDGEARVMSRPAMQMTTLP